MRITAVHTAVVEANYDWTFVRVQTDDEALSGLGECFTAPGLTRIVADLAPLLVGEDPRDVDRLWSKLRWGASGAGSVAGIVWNAISGMEAALWDLVGRAYGVPIHRLLGGRYRDTVRVYADCHAGEALEALDATMVPRPPRWAETPGEERDPAAVRHPEHGRAHVFGAAGESFTPEMYAERARDVSERMGFSALKFDLDVPTAHAQDTASGTLTRGEIAAMAELAAAAVGAVGGDTESVEVLPSIVEGNPHPVHIALLIERGIHIIEMLDLEELARDRVHEFCFVCLPLKISGATGSYVRPVAVI